jgi:ABC-type phosphate transport system substrate-binding protein
MGFTCRKLLLLLAAVSFAPTQGYASDPPLAVIVHPEVEAKQLNDVDLEAIFLTERRYWSGTKSIIPFNLPPRSDGRVLFDRVVLRMDPEGIARYWLDRRVRSGTPPPKQAPDPMTVCRLVAKLPGAIGYVPESMVTHEVRAIAIIRNGKVLAP